VVCLKFHDRSSLLRGDCLPAILLTPQGIHRDERTLQVSQLDELRHTRDCMGPSTFRWPNTRRCRVADALTIYITSLL
jgi:hypothetical protein